MKTFGGEPPALATLEYEAVAGKPAPEIRRLARARCCDLIVISRHGRTGMRKPFFGLASRRGVVLPLDADAPARSRFRLPLGGELPQNRARTTALSAAPRTGVLLTATPS